MMDILDRIKLNNHKTSRRLTQPDGCRSDRSGAWHSAPAVRRKAALWLFLPVLLFLLSGCSKKQEKNLLITSIWDVSETEAGGEAYDFATTTRTVQMERKGFLRGMEDYPADLDLKEIVLSEKIDLRGNTQRLAEIYSEQDVLMTVGASRDENTMYAAMTNAFFGTPILIPFSDGDLVTDTGQEFAMRMTPVSQQYADYIGTYLFPANTEQTINTVLFENTPMRDYKITFGVFFADNFNGHETSVKITQRLMDNGMDIDYYRPFSSGELLTVFNNCWNEENSTLPDMDVLVIIGEDNDELPNLGKVLKYWDSRVNKPIVFTIGYNPGLQDPDVFAAENLFGIQQAIDMSNCPADIINHEEAMGYAAGYTAMMVLDRANSDQPAETSHWWNFFRTDAVKQQDHLNYVESFRSKIYSTLMTLNENIPCFGKLSFSSAASDTRDVELVTYIDADRCRTVDPSVIMQMLIERVRVETQ